MAYRLETGRPVEHEMRRIVNRQIELALVNMQGIGGRENDKATHGGRRHIKKIRALLRLFEPSLGVAYGPAKRRLRTVSRLLGPIADSESVIDTLRRIGEHYRKELPTRTLVAVHEGLVQLDVRANRRAKAARVLDTATRLLRAEQKHAHSLLLKKSGFRSVAQGLERSVCRSRRAMALALECPTSEHYHACRQRVKDLWLQVRLLRGRCDGRLAEHEARLEQLDGCLGEYHNCVLLTEVLVAEALVPRRDTARCLRLIRRYQAELRREIRPLAIRVYRDKPRRFVKRVHRLWQLTQSVKRPAEGNYTWPRAV